MFRKRLAMIILMMVAFSHLIACQADPRRMDLLQPTTAQTTDPSSAGLAGLRTQTLPVVPKGFTTIQKQVFETLFAKTYDPAYFAYDIVDTVSGLGTYQGQNQFADPFNLDVLFEGPIALTDLGLSPQDLAAAQAGDMHYSSILAWIEARGQRVAVSGAYFDGNVPGQGYQARFMVTAIEDENSEVFNPTPPPRPSAPAWQPTPTPATLETTVAIAPSDASKCIQDCYDDYNAAVDAAQSDYDAAAQAAQDTFDAAEQSASDARDEGISDANNAYDSAKSSADAWLVGELVVCHTALIGGITACTITTGIWSIFTFGLPLAGCIAAVHVVYAICTAAAIGLHSNALSQAATNRNDAIDIANNAYDNAVNAAATQLQADLSAAAAALQAALAQAQADLLACLNGCKKKRQELKLLNN